MTHDPYYRDALALVHHLGFGFHADACAGPLLRLLEPELERDAQVVELGCGSGLLTRHLLDAGLRVVATDASTAMLDLAADHARGAQLQRVALPDDPIPAADAVVGVGHVLNYVGDSAALERAAIAAARAVRPGGLLALDVCDLAYGSARPGRTSHVDVRDDWAICTRFEQPDAATFVRHITVFLRRDDGSWERSDETHHNVLVDTAALAATVSEAAGFEVAVRDDLDGEHGHPPGLRFLVGRRPV